MDGAVGASDAWRLAQEAKTFMSHLFPALFLSFSLNRENAQVTKYRIPFPISHYYLLSRCIACIPLQTSLPRSVAKKKQGEYVC